MKKRTLLILAAAIVGAVAAPIPASAQTWWNEPVVVVPAGTGLLIVSGPVPPTLVAVPIVTTARPVTAGPLLRVSGCYWARERGPKGWVRFRACR